MMTSNFGGRHCPWAPSGSTTLVNLMKQHLQHDIIIYIQFNHMYQLHMGNLWGTYSVWKMIKRMTENQADKHNTQEARNDYD